jgi:hypothetical protein
LLGHGTVAAPLPEMDFIDLCERVCWPEMVEPSSVGG